MTPAIETFGLARSYGDVHALSGLDLHVEPGEVFGFLGPNGAGKTTTIRLLLALQRPTAGRAEICGFDAQRDSVEIHRRVGYLPGELE
ncbi:MAG: ATP-binding cassette domain-containing protein, partial [Tepidiformaceae bacterium]